MNSIRTGIAGLILLVAFAVGHAAQPPDQINYQGVLRDASDAPLDGTYPMVFRFYDSPSLGDYILRDAHLLSGKPVEVVGGMFNVRLGSGDVTDGPGPGTYTSLAEVFRDYSPVYLEIEIDREVLTPRVRIVSAGYALNSDHLDGVDSTQMLRSDESDTYAAGTLTIDAGAKMQVNGALAMGTDVQKNGTGLVGNFNADLLDGLHSTDFAASAHGHAGTDITGPVAEAENADTVDGKHASEFIDTSSTAQTKPGEFTADASTIPSSYGVRGYGQTGGGYFADSNGSGHAEIGYGDYGIRGYGTTMGGRFEDTDNSGVANLAYGNRGISAAGNSAGGYFKDSDGSGYAYAGYGDYGVRGFGDTAGGYFKDSDSTGYAYIGRGDSGIEAYGYGMGGYFEDADDAGYAFVGYGNRGIEAYGSWTGGYFGDIDGSGQASVGNGDRGIHASGNLMGGNFEDLNGSGYAYVGYNDRGIHAAGNVAGGHFEDRDSTGYAYIGFGDRGIEAYGNDMGGYFKALETSGYAYVGNGHKGIDAYGDLAGGYFSDRDESGYAYVGSGDFGVEGYGNTAGGRFEDLESLVWARVGSSTYKITGSGSVNFVQNHPYEKDKVIVYTAPEGDETATYTRGSARLVDGEARVTLGETFPWVTNPDIGLTAHLTPRGDCAGLYAESITTSEMVVRELGGGTSDVAFDYIVYGLRIGFEETGVVQEKREESYIPSMKDHHERYARNPGLRAYNALERFKGMAARLSGTDAAEIDFSGAEALRAAVQEYDPEVHEVIQGRSVGEGVEPIESTVDKAPVSRAEAALSYDLEEDVPYGTMRMPVSEPVEQGDVLALDPNLPGSLCRADSLAAPTVIGVAAGPARSVPDGGLEVSLSDGRYGTVKVDAGYGEIRPGDLLAVSPTPGHAMRAMEAVPGTVLGRALEPLQAGTGTVRVLLDLQ